MDIKGQQEVVFFSDGAAMYPSTSGANILKS